MEKVRIAEPTNEVCPECGKPLLLRMGRYGKFLGCSGYPGCRYTRPFTTPLGVACPECGKPLVQRRAKATRRVFYGCSGYPDCKFISRFRPLAEPCPRCGKLMVAYGKGGARCTKCDYKGGIVPAQAEAVAA
jgi:DNA topoisomerase-1